MRTAVLLRNVVGVAVHVLLVGVIPLQAELDRNRVLLAAEPDDRIVDRRLVAVQIADELTNAALVLEYFALVVALIDQLDSYTRVQERQLADSLGEHVVVELDIREDLGAGFETDNRPPLVRHACLRQRRLGVAQAVLLGVELAVAVDGQQQVLG